MLAHILEVLASVGWCWLWCWLSGTAGSPPGGLLATSEIWCWLVLALVLAPDGRVAPGSLVLARISAWSLDQFYPNFQDHFEDLQTDCTRNLRKIGGGKIWRWLPLDHFFTLFYLSTTFLHLKHDPFRLYGPFPSRQ